MPIVAITTHLYFTCVVNVIAEDDAKSPYQAAVSYWLIYIIIQLNENIFKFVVLAGTIAKVLNDNLLSAQ